MILSTNVRMLSRYEYQGVVICYRDDYTLQYRRICREKRGTRIEAQEDAWSLKRKILEDSKLIEKY